MRALSNRITHFDVRSIPSTAWHVDVMSTFEQLGPCDEVQLASRHELRPLRTRLEASYPDQYLWSQHMAGAQYWITRLKRLPKPSASMLDVLRRSPLLAAASPGTLQTLAATSMQCTLTYDQSVVEEDAGWEAFGMVKTGKVAAIATSPDGREHTLYESLAYESFGELSAIDGGTAALRFSVKSDKACVLLFRKSAVEAALTRDPAFTRSLNALLAQRARLLVKRYTTQTTLPTVARVAAALLPHTPAGPGLQTVFGSMRDLTHRELASAAGTVKEVVCRALAELESAHAIQRLKGHIVRANRERLIFFSGAASSAAGAAYHAPSRSRNPPERRPIR